MPHRAERSRNREAREAPAREAAELDDFITRAETKLKIRREFLAEVLLSGGLVDLSFRPRGESHYINVYGGKVMRGEDWSLGGDSIVNSWKLPTILGFRIRFDEQSAVIARLESPFDAIDVSDPWVKTTGEAQSSMLSLDPTGPETNLVVSKHGLASVAWTVGHIAGNEAVAKSLEYVGEKIF